jgi:transposase-like protein
MKTTGTSQKRWSTQEIDQLVGDYRRGELTQEAYAGQIGVKVHTLRSWLYKRKARSPAGFAAVRVEGGGPERGGAVTVRWPQGIEVDLPLALGEPVLRAWLRKLLSPCSR